MRKHDKREHHEKKSENKEKFDYSQYLSYLNKKDEEQMNKFVNKWLIQAYLNFIIRINGMQFYYNLYYISSISA